MSEIVLNKLLSSGIVSVVRRVDPEKVPSLVSALVSGGVTAIELTVDSEDAFSQIHSLKTHYGDRAVIGAGTVVNQAQAKEAINAGADFIFAPIVDKLTIEYTKSQEKIMIPGAFSPTEIHQAYAAGADVIKVFPARALGPTYFKDIRAPLGDIPLMPTGGITLENIQDYFKAGAVAAGIGGSLINKKLIENEKWEEIENLATQYAEAVKQAKSGD